MRQLFFVNIQQIELKQSALQLQLIRWMNGSLHWNPRGFPRLTVAHPFPGSLFRWWTWPQKMLPPNEISVETLVLQVPYASSNPFPRWELRAATNRRQDMAGQRARSARTLGHLATNKQHLATSNQQRATAIHHHYNVTLPWSELSFCSCSLLPMPFKLIMAQKRKKVTKTI